MRVASVTSAASDIELWQFDFLFCPFEKFAQLGSAFFGQERCFSPCGLQCLCDGVLSRQALCRTAHARPSDFILFMGADVGEELAVIGEAEQIEQ